MPSARLESPTVPPPHPTLPTASSCRLSPAESPSFPESRRPCRRAWCTVARCRAESRTSYPPCAAPSGAPEAAFPRCTRTASPAEAPRFRRRADECARPATAPRCRRRSSPRTVPLHSSAHCGGSFRHRCSPCGRKRTGSAAALRSGSAGRRIRWWAW